MSMADSEHSEKQEILRMGFDESTADDLGVSCNSGVPLPRGAVEAGTNKTGDPLYAGRAFYNGDLLPAKINPKLRSAYVSWGGMERATSSYEYLCNANVAWQTAYGSHIPPNAVVMGFTVSGEKLYMGRTYHAGTLTPGKVHPSHGKLYIPFYGEEIPFTKYEIMIHRSPCGRNESSVIGGMTGGYGWVQCNSDDPLPRGAVKVGSDHGDVPLYAGRGYHQGDLLPAKINPNHSSVYVCWGGNEHSLRNYEVLCHANVMWQTVYGSHIPSNAVDVGFTVSGEKLYMGRTHHAGTLTPGKIQPSHGKLYIPYGGKEVSCSKYEIMVQRQ